MKDLVGKQMYGFSFKLNTLHYSPTMDEYIDKVAIILEEDEHDGIITFRVKFEDGEVWSYPYPEILENLVEDEKTINELITKMKQLTSELWKTKI